MQPAANVRYSAYRSVGRQPLRLLEFSGCENIVSILTVALAFTGLHQKDNRGSTVVGLCFTGIFSLMIELPASAAK